MSVTLLLDLDDTLLVNDINTFLPAYMDAFARHVSDFLEPNKFIQALLAGTQRMVANQIPHCTLREVFNDAFYSLVEVDQQEFEDLAYDFYERVFPTLEPLTQPIPAAVNLVEAAFERGYRIAITTNPLFPEIAIHQRLLWAGLSPAKYPFDLITAYETFHFSKPNPAYFAEALGRLGWLNGTVIVVGDDPIRDIAAAQKLGLQTYWVGSDSTEPPQQTEYDQAGSLDQLLPWVDEILAEDLSPELETPPALLATLRATPAVVDSFCRSLTSVTWSNKPAPDEWCPTEIVCHLRDVEIELNLPRVEKILGETNPFLPAEDTDRWADDRQYICQNGDQALLDFSKARMQLVEQLDQLALEDWQRPARHSIFGRTQLREIVKIISGHDRLHIQQLHRDLNLDPRNNQ